LPVASRDFRHESHGARGESHYLRGQSSSSSYISFHQRLIDEERLAK
jgi:hypothetical protein